MEHERRDQQLHADEERYHREDDGPRGGGTGTDRLRDDPDAEPDSPRHERETGEEEQRDRREGADRVLPDEPLPEAAKEQTTDRGDHLAQADARDLPPVARRYGHVECPDPHDVEVDEQIVLE